jgi:large subunit ribosomal protein L25
MIESSELIAARRTVIGKASRRLASEGRIPAVLYGPGRDSLPISLDRHDFELWMGHHAAGSAMIELTVEGEKKKVNAMIRDVHRSAVKGTILHVDLLEVAMDKAVHATVPLRLLSDPEGVKSGGILTVSMHEVAIEALPKDLPEAVECDVAHLQMGDALHLGDVVAPDGVTLLGDADAIVASIQAPRAEVEEEPGVEVAEPEIIGAKSDDEG